MKSNVCIVLLCIFALSPLCYAKQKPRVYNLDKYKSADNTPLPGTSQLTRDDDISSSMVSACDDFMLAEIEKSISRRAKHWNRDFSSTENYNKSIEPNRKRFAHILGLKDERVAFDVPQFVGSLDQPVLVGKGKGFDIYSIQWPVFGDVSGQGLLCVPRKDKKVADVVAIPHSRITPEMLLGLTEGVPAESQFARRLAENGCRVLVPLLISSETYNHCKDSRWNKTLMSHREYIQRAAIVLGRNIIGYEMQKIFAAVDWFSKEGGDDVKIGLIGYGEGGLLAMYCTAFDTRVDAACVSGYFDDRQKSWQEPLYRDVFALLEQFGDAEIASMICPRPLVVEACKGPNEEAPSHRYAAPGNLVSPELADVRKEIKRAKALVAGFDAQPQIELIVSDDGQGPFGSADALKAFLNNLSPKAKLVKPDKIRENNLKNYDPQKRLLSQVHEIDRHNQYLVKLSPNVRKEFWKNADVNSVEKYEQSTEWYRDYFHEEVMGRFDYPLLNPNVRTRKSWETDKWTAYQVVMDVFDGLYSYGILVVPKGIKPGEKRPVVVCQHGINRRPKMVIVEEGTGYHGFAGALAERGFITYAPQNPHIFYNRFRQVARKGHSIKKTLYSIIVPQHQQIVNWLSSLDFTDPQRIAFYGLSYGGKTAMQVPPLVKNYCLSICSGSFGEWIWKCIRTDKSGFQYGYIWFVEYEMFDFDLASTFNHAEMAALIAPRPFMVERGHGDIVAPDEWVEYEYSKVRGLYDKLGIGDRTEIEIFNGGHEIHGQGTFDFLHKHLHWPKPKEK